MREQERELPLHTNLMRPQLSLMSPNQTTSQLDQWVKNLLANVGDMGLIPGSGRSPGGRHGNPL